MLIASLTAFYAIVRDLKLTYRNFPKFSDRQVWSNSADPDQTAPRGGNFLNIQTPQKFVVMTLKVEQDGISLE